MPPRLLLLSLPLADTKGRQVIVTISSDQPPELIIAMGMGQVRLPDTEADRLAAWWQAWMAQRRQAAM